MWSGQCLLHLIFNFLKKDSSHSSISKPENIDWMRLNPEKLSNSITLLVDADDPEILSRVVRAARDLRKDNPYTLYQIVLTSETRIPSEKLVERIRDAFMNSAHYYELMNSFPPIRRLVIKPEYSLLPRTLPLRIEPSKKLKTWRQW